MKRAAFPIPPPSKEAKRVGAVALGALVGLVVIISIFAGAVTGVMHGARQDRLVSSFNSRAPVVKYGQAIGVIQIQKIGLDEVVIEGDSVGNLRAGPAHQSESPLPGEQGNTVLVGHKRLYGGPFRNLAKLAQGDQIVFQGKSGDPTAFEVAEVLQTDTSGAQAAASKRPEVESLTLVTNRGGWFSGAKTVVIATRVGAPGAAASATSRDQPPAVPPLRLESSAASALWLLLWLVVLGYLALLLSRLIRVRSRVWALASSMGPLLVFATLQALLTLERLLPVTV
jgi:sortase A